VDEAAESDMALLQDIVGAARNLRAELKLDPKEQLEGVLYSTGRAYHLVAEAGDVISRFTAAKLTHHRGNAPKITGAMRATPAFDLGLNVSESQLAALKTRLDKENDQLKKNVVNIERQLGDEKFLARAPEHVVAELRTKLAEYKAQLAKNEEALKNL